MEPIGEVVEIRIHGVSNTPPEDMLGVGTSHLLRQVAGDADTALWQAEPDPKPDRRHRVVAYSWGKLTNSRDRAVKDLYRALWMLLLPFAFVNVALWMLPPDKDQPNPEPPPHRNPRDEPVTTSGLSSFLIRLFALSSTATLTLIGVGVVLDQVVWQWAGANLEAPKTESISAGEQTAGVADVGWLSIVRLDPSSAQAGRSIAIGATIATLVVLLAWAVARRSFQYEGEVSESKGQTTADIASRRSPASLMPLERKEFWRGRRQVSNLSYLHLATALSIVAVFAVLPTRGRLTEEPQWWSSAALVSGAVAAVVVAVSVMLLWSPGVVTRAADNAEAPEVLRSSSLCRICALVAAANLLAVVFGLSFTPMNLGAPTGGLPGYDTSLLWVVTGQAVAVAVVAAIAFTMSRRGRRGGTRGDKIGSDKSHLDTSGRWDTAWFGTGPALLLTAGWILGLLYGAVTMFFTADYLNGDGKPFGGDPSIRLPPALLTASVTVVPFLAAFVVIAGVCVWYVTRLARGAWRQVLGEYEPPGSNRPLGEIAEHRKAQARRVAAIRARHVFFGDPLLGVVGLLGAIAYALAIVGIILTFTFDQPATASEVVGQMQGTAPTEVATAENASWLFATVNTLTGLGARTLLLLAVALAWVATQVYRGGAARRILGIVWDVGTFWPRSAHPWAPPCYAERVVPQLVTYISNRRLGPGFVLAGHSQGSVIAAATLWQLPPEHRARCGLLTFGTQLRAFYGRAFPRYFGPSQLQTLVNSVPWISLRRLTDPIGYRVNLDAGIREVDEPPVVDPADLSPKPNDFVDQPIYGHGDYPLDPRLHQAAETVIRQLRATL